MTTLWDFLTGRWLQRVVCSGILIWICWRLGYDNDSYLPWIIVLLTWTQEYLAWQDGVVLGAKNWDKLPEATKRKARELFNRLDNDKKDTE